MKIARHLFKGPEVTLHLHPQCNVLFIFWGEKNNASIPDCFINACTVTSEEHMAPFYSNAFCIHWKQQNQGTDLNLGLLVYYFGNYFHHNTKLYGYSFLERKGLDWYLEVDVVEVFICQF